MPQTTQRKKSLPHDITSFVGRRKATAELKHALSESRLVTLTGVGGVGKSRLALRVGRELQRAFPDGVWLVELAEIQDPAFVPSAVAATLGVLEQSARDAETVLVDYLASKRLLLLLDNCEHLLESCCVLTDRLLSAAPGLRVLATSREPLGIIAERVWPVPPLSIPAPDATGARRDRPYTDYEALALFQDRASMVMPGFTIGPDNAAAVIRLCRDLDGVPLAIELAAVRMRTLTADQILARLENRFRLLTSGNRAAAPRHQTLRAAVEWSFELCTESERVLWARCSIFAGEFDLDAVESVCTGDDAADEDVFASVAGLIGKSVLAVERSGRTARYRMLETIRQFGQERLAETGETEALRTRHRDYYLRLAEEADAGSCGQGQSELGDRLRADRTNFWAALDHCCTVPGEARTGLRMATALWYYWIACGFVRDGRYWLDRALALDTAPSGERAKALWINGWIAHLQGEPDASLEFHRQSRDMAERLGDEATLTFATQFLGDSEMWAGDLADAARLLDHALARHRASGRWTAPGLLAFALRAQTAGLLGDVDHAVALLDECRAICASLGERWALSWTEWNVGVTWWSLNEPAKAIPHLRASLLNKQRLNDLIGIPCCVELLSWVAAAAGDFRRAAVLLGFARKMWEPIGRPLFGSETLLAWSRQRAEETREALGDAEFDADLRKGAQITQEDLVAYAVGGGEAEPRTATPVPPEPDSDTTLTARECEVARLVAQGLSNKQIAAELVIAQRTAEGHVERILQKLGFSSRAQIAGWMARRRADGQGGR
ncbi:ATP-binding protein [Actinoallomurus sp. CA-150999]|uniref:ATP-binding protein n=1 Tax=Actinoallomurus sp. CA-150999 TaxID=3239887 RepID=UPI003D8D9915